MFDIRGRKSSFLGYGNNTKLIFSIDNTNDKIHRTKHFRIDKTHSSILHHSLPIGVKNIINPTSLIEFPDVSLKPVKDPFSLYNASDKFEVFLPLPAQDAPLNIVVDDDEYFNIPVLKSITARHPWHQYLPTPFKRNAWITMIHDDKPITSDGVLATVKRLIDNRMTEALFGFCKQKSSNKTKLEEHRAMVNGVCPVIHQASSMLAIISTSPPEQCSTFSDVLKSPYKDKWKRAIFEHCNNNAAVGAVSKPFPIDEVDDDIQILQSLLVPNLKPDKDHDNLYKFKVRHCLNGGLEIAGFRDTYSLVVQANSLRLYIALAARCCLLLHVIDVVNTF